MIYDAIDDWDTSLGGGWFRDSVEKSIVDHAHVLVATAKPLADKLERTAKRPAHLLPNAVDLRLFDRSVHHARPKDMLDSDRTAVYVGALWGEWFDWGLLLHLANSLPSAMFVVVGDYRGQISRPPTNLQFVGLKSQTEVPAYLANAQAGIIPWRLCAISRATSPLKAYEYLAMGLPVVAPDLDTLPDAPLVFRSANNRDFIRNVETAMGLSRFEMNLDEFLRRNTWSSRVDELEELLEA